MQPACTRSPRSLSVMLSTNWRSAVCWSALATATTHDPAPGNASMIILGIFVTALQIQRANYARHLAKNSDFSRRSAKSRLDEHPVKHRSHHSVTVSVGFIPTVRAPLLHRHGRVNDVAR